MPSPSRAARRVRMSFSIDGPSPTARLLLTGSVTEVQDSHADVRDENAPFCDGTNVIPETERNEKEQAYLDLGD